MNRKVSKSKSSRDLCGRWGWPALVSGQLQRASSVTKQIHAIFLPTSMMCHIRCSLRQNKLKVEKVPDYFAVLRIGLRQWKDRVEDGRMGQLPLSTRTSKMARNLHRSTGTRSLFTCHTAAYDEVEAGSRKLQRPIKGLPSSVAAISPSIHVLPSTRSKLVCSWWSLQL